MKARCRTARLPHLQQTAYERPEHYCAPGMLSCQLSDG